VRLLPLVISSGGTIHKKFYEYLKAMIPDQQARRALSELGADLNIPDKYGQTPVWMATAGGNVEAIRILFELGADISIPNKKATATVKLSASSRCKTTYYCSAACQKQDWKQHKQTFETFAAAADQA
jgi:hypothetical protein